MKNQKRQEDHNVKEEASSFVFESFLGAFAKTTDRTTYRAVAERLRQDTKSYRPTDIKFSKLRRIVLRMETLENFFYGPQFVNNAEIDPSLTEPLQKFYLTKVEESLNRLVLDPNQVKLPLADVLLTPTGERVVRFETLVIRSENEKVFAACKMDGETVNKQHSLIVLSPSGQPLATTVTDPTGKGVKGILFLKYVEGAKIRFWVSGGYGKPDRASWVGELRNGQLVSSDPLKNFR